MLVNSKVSINSKATLFTFLPKYEHARNYYLFRRNFLFVLVFVIWCTCRVHLVFFWRNLYELQLWSNYHMPRTLFYRIITPEDKEWDRIRELQRSGKLPWILRQVFVYTNPRQYERNVLEMEHWKVVEVRLQRNFPMSISPLYKEIIKHQTCYNPLEGRLHVFLKEHESLEDLDKKRIFTPPIYKSWYLLMFDSACFHNATYVSIEYYSIGIYIESRLKSCILKTYI